MVFKITDLAAVAALRKRKAQHKKAKKACPKATRCMKHTCLKPTPQTCCRASCVKTTGGPSTCDWASTEGRDTACQDLWSMLDQMDALSSDVEALVAAKEGRKTRSKRTAKKGKAKKGKAKKSR